MTENSILSGAMTDTPSYLELWVLFLISQKQGSKVIHFQFINLAILNGLPGNHVDYLHFRGIFVLTLVILNKLRYHTHL